MGKHIQHVDCPLLLSYFKPAWDVLTGFSKTSPVPNFVEIHVVVLKLVYAD